MRTLTRLVPLALLASLTTPVTHAEATTPPDRVLLISIDALNPKALSVLGPKQLPNLFRLKQEGAGTTNARTLFESTETLPNHTGMLTGQPVSMPGGTGVTFNADNGQTLNDSAGRYVSGVFDVVHDNGGSTAMYVAKDKFKFLERSWDATNGAPDTTGADNGRNKIDRFVYAEAQESVLVRELRTQLVDDPATFTFLHLAAPDRAGHAFGGMTPEYLTAVKKTDRLLGKVLKTIRSVPALRDHLLVVLTADHGTRATSHADPTQLVNYRVPFFAWGAGVEHKGLYALNRSFTNPRKARPTYAGPQPIRNGNVANLVTRFLDLPTVPGSKFTALDLG